MNRPYIITVYTETHGGHTMSFQKLLFKLYGIILLLQIIIFLYIYYGPLVYIP